MTEHDSHAPEITEEVQRFLDLISIGNVDPDLETVLHRGHDPRQVGIVSLRQAEESFDKMRDRIARLQAALDPIEETEKTSATADVMAALSQPSPYPNDVEMMKEVHATRLQWRERWGRYAAEGAL